MQAFVAAGFSLRNSGQVSSTIPQAKACGYKKLWSSLIYEQR
jgi:hypothetical protein